MATKETTIYRDDTGEDRMVVEKTSTVASPLGMIRNVVYVVFAALETLLLIRFFLELFGANSSNSFANFIYSVSAPFVAPFRGLFNIHTELGTGLGRFSFETLVAVAVYVLLAALILMVLDIPEKDA